MSPLSLALALALSTRARAQTEEEIADLLVGRWRFDAAASSALAGCEPEEQRKHVRAVEQESGGLWRLRFRKDGTSTWRVGDQRSEMEWRLEREEPPKVSDPSSLPEILRPLHEQGFVVILYVRSAQGSHPPDFKGDGMAVVELTRRRLVLWDVGCPMAFR